MSDVHAHIPLDYVNNQQPDDATDVESTELFEFSEGMKFGVVFKAGFITRVAVLSYGTFLIVTTLLGQVHIFLFLKVLTCFLLERRGCWFAGNGKHMSNSFFPD